MDGRDEAAGGRRRARPRWPDDAPMPEAEHRAFLAGAHHRLHERLGAHREADGRVRFGVWAPHAARVSVIGSFNGWDPEALPLERVAGSGLWCGRVAGVRPGDRYKLRIVSRVGGYSVDKADPFARRAEEPPATASVFWEPEHAWTDADWLARRASANPAREPLAVYELHLGSWRRSERAAMPTYAEVAERLVPYVVELGFTHVELLPVTEHPFYGSWGYQATGYFAPTSRWGPPEGLMALIDALHAAGIGVILDWVPSHFPSDAHGPGFFDGTHLFEPADPRRGYHPDWRSCIFDYDRGEVRSFLLSSACSWIERYHVDALRVDAVASMLYLDYSRKAGEWLPNRYGGRENLEAIRFLRDLNGTIHREHPGALTIAEESTAWPRVSGPAHLGGLGFDMKWDMGWMHDTLGYMARDPVHRKYHHDQLTFRMVYAFSERFVLPLSHDEVVHGKGSLLGKMPGDAWQKLANHRALLGYMYGMPGKKLLFMGAEIGQWLEWSHESALPWGLLDHPWHAGVQQWVTALNALYREDAALHGADFEPAGFEWVDCRDADHSVVAFLRRPPGGGEPLLVVCNFTPLPRDGYRIGVPAEGRWDVVLNGDAERFGGSGYPTGEAAEALAMRFHGRPHSIVLDLPPLAVLFLRRAAEAPPAAAPGAVTDSRRSPPRTPST